MKQVISTERIPIKMWLDEIEDGAMEQAQNLANLPFAFKHIVLLADCHRGYGMPIGSVLATKGIVVPNSVGKDISCGVIAKKTSLIAKDVTCDDLKQIMGLIRRDIPVGLNGKHKKPFPEDCMPSLKDGLPVVRREFLNASKSLKSLGSGNHFIEIQRDDEGYIWVMIHSGSRNLGSKVADHYNDLAKKVNAKYFSTVTPNQDLAFLPMGTEDAHSYWDEMTYCMLFAQKK